jgi:hypothetical protein
MHVTRHLIEIHKYYFKLNIHLGEVKNCSYIVELIQSLSTEGI